MKTPPRAEPDIKDPEVFERKFEVANKDLELHYTKATMDGFYDLLDDIAYLYER